MDYVAPIGSGVLTLITAPSPNPASGSATDSLPLAPSALQNLPQNAVLRGTVRQRGPNNTFTIQTNRGMFTVQSDMALPKDGQVALRAEQQAQGIRLRLITVDGQSLNNYVQSLQQAANAARQDAISPRSGFLQSGGVATSQPSPTQSAPASQGMSLNSDGESTIRGVFLSKPAFTPAQLAPLPASLQRAVQQAVTGTSLTVKVHQVQAPDPSGQGYIPLSQQRSAPNATGSTAQMANAASTNTTPTNHTVAPASQSLFSTAAAQIKATTASTATPPPSATTPATPTPSAPATAPASSTSQASSPVFVQSTPASQQPNVFTAKVIENSHPRELTLQSHFGSFKLFVTAPLPKGSILEFSLLQAMPVRGGLQSQPATQTETQPAGPTRDSALNELTSLQHKTSYTATAQEIAAPPSVLPRPGPNLTAELLFLMSALRGGDMRRWLGEDNISRLQSMGKGADFFSRVAQEFNGLNLVATNKPDGEWQQLQLPIYHEGQLEAISLSYKRQRQQRDDGEEQETNHFLVEIDLSCLGRVQLDGLVQYQPQHHQFDLILRTQQEWPTALQDDIRDIYQQAQEISGFAGMLQFQQGNDALIALPVDNDDKGASNNENSIVV